MMSEIYTGRIVDADRDGITIRTPVPTFFTKREYDQVNVEFIDGRPISNEQRKKAWAIMTDIARWAGTNKDETYILFRWRFTQSITESLKRKLFHLSSATMTEAREFINYLIVFVLDFDVPLRVPLYENSDDIEFYMKQCLIHKKCAVCGKLAQLHHVDRVGSHGGSRATINHIGLKAYALCAEHHSELHAIGQAEFDERYHFQPIPIDEEIAKVYRLNTKGKKEQ